MQWQVVKGRPADADVDLLVLLAHENDAGPDLCGVDDLPADLRADLATATAGKVFAGAAETWLLLPGRGTAATWLLLVGLGKRADLSLNRVRRCAGVAAGQARRIETARCAVSPASLTESGFDLQSVTRCWVEGVQLALSPTGELKSKAAEPSTQAEKPPVAWTLVERDGRRLNTIRRGVSEGDAYASGCLFARRLVNLPANYLTPSKLADEARTLARREGMRCRVLDRDRLAKKQMGGLLGVSQGSSQPPCLIVIETQQKRRRGSKEAPVVALVGKGVTFDSGGISLKPPAKMDLMKIDMAGAAAVLGAALTIVRLDLPVRLLIVIPATENLPDGTAVKPGDVLTMASGKTVEVINTDAEGRLILADALHYACGRGPQYVIDAATLTGACAVALGEYFAGLLGNSAELLEVLNQAGGETFERIWHLPLVEEHHKAIESQVADLKNLGPREAGVSTAAAFLAAFVDESTAWAHLDVAGPVWTDKAGPLGPKGATGFGARLLARTVEILVS